MGFTAFFSRELKGVEVIFHSNGNFAVIFHKNSALDIRWCSKKLASGLGVSCDVDHREINHPDEF